MSQNVYVSADRCVLVRVVDGAGRDAECRRAQSSMTPCVIRDGDLARAGADRVCVGCGEPVVAEVAVSVATRDDPADVWSPSIALAREGSSGA